MRFIIGITIYFLFQNPLSAQYKSINSFVSQEQTVNGFSNFFLGVNQAEPYIATNPRDPLNTICSFILGSYYTLDGLNWNSISTLNNSADPFLAFDSIGNAYYSPGLYWQANNISVLKSTDKGITWQNNYLIYTGNNDRPALFGNRAGGIYSNYLYAAWENIGAPGLFFGRSTNQGVTWSYMPFNVPGNYYCPYIAIGPSGTIPGGIIYYGFIELDTFPSVHTVHVKIMKSTDAGITFSSKITVDSNCIHPTIKNGAMYYVDFIQMSADNSYGPYRGNVYIVYTGKGTGTDNADIFFVKSTNYGANWSAPLKLNDDNTSGDQWMAAISVDKSGKIYIVWYDSRIDPQNFMTQLYGTVSTNGGVSFVPDFPVSTTPFNPVNAFMGHYISVSAIGNTAIASWTDARNNNSGGYVGYLPDYAMTVAPEIINLGSNDSLTAVIKIPSIKGPYVGNIKFTCELDSLPPQGNISINFAGKDSVTTIPDSVYLKIKLTNVNVPKRYRITVTGRNTSYGVPVHARNIDLMVNSSYLNIGTNRNGRAGFKVNGTLYNTWQNLFFLNNSNVTVQAISPVNVSGMARYMFVNWSDAGDTTHSFVINANTTLTAYYKTQFNLSLVSSIGNSFGGNTYYDSLQSFTFGVLSKIIVYNGQVYRFRGWDGNPGGGSYTSPDSTGNDTAVTWSMFKSIIEIARWTPVTGISQISSEIPDEYKLYNAYPNPFNPSTKIKYDIPVRHSGEGRNPVVKVIIYDALGREVETLSNKQMNAGSYIVDFNGSKLSSGIYFCRLSTAGFTDIKRLVLLK
ncbi:MAG: T9SS type A sorting domain-containing protein [Ignavibacteriae bacterium]|nr:T9SS type A sorting domain-containing protein [Ignavibacteriota bacterium]